MHLNSNHTTKENLQINNAVFHMTMTPFDAPRKQALENTVGKGEIARNEQFLLFSQCFLPFWITCCQFRQI